MRRVRSRLTYSNVVTTILLFLVLGGGSAYALSGSNTVFSDDIVNGQVKTPDLATPPGGPVFAGGSINGNSPTYLIFLGSGNSSAGSMTMPSVPLVGGHMAVTLDRRPDAGCAQAPNCARRFTLLVNNKPTPVTCTIAGDAKTCNSGDASVRIPPASQVAIKAEIESGTMSTANARIAWMASQP